MITTPDFPRRHMQSGISLVEIMVGMVVALITTVAIMETYRGYEGQRRTTGASSESQTSGQFAQYQLDRDLRMAGYGLTNVRAGVGCNFGAAYAASLGPTGIFPVPPAAPAGLNAPVILPVLIADGGAAADGIRVMRATGGNAIPFNGVVPPLAPTTFNVTAARSNVAFMVNRGDLALQINTIAGTCQLGQVTNDPDNNNLTQIAFTPGGATCSRNACPSSTFNQLTALVGATELAHLGTLSVQSYTVRNNAMNATNGVLGASYDGVGALRATAPAIATMAGQAEVLRLADQVIDLQAQYGVDTVPADVVTDISNWVEPTGVYAAAALTPIQARMIRGVRFAIVSRNNLRERPTDGVNCDATPPAVQAASVRAITFPNGPAINVDMARGSLPTDGPNEWRCYRYQVFTGVVPLRNMIWNTRGIEP
ncbi:PilW family protein [Chitinimonas viridis]|uniref:PilW family protein n=1 Tax=Chitinimonas viridis TaxID=664880 RepID=A0ABT8B2S6_9NEIS|nr:PilW family protein [Chitinimonas viridis]MDN3575789.1 PilW family protein [Chitinimonas viridis]